MLTLLNSTRLGLIACRRLVWGYRQKLWLSGPEIAEHYGMNPRALQPALHSLTTCGLLLARRGGTFPGFFLARPPEDITLLDVVTALEGELRTLCCRQLIPELDCGCTTDECSVCRILGTTVGDLKSRLQATSLARHADAETGFSDALGGDKKRAETLCFAKPEVKKVENKYTMHVKSKYPLLIAVLLAGLLALPARAELPCGPQVPQDSLHARIYFRHGYSTLETDYRDNGERLERFGRAVRDLSRDTTATLRRIRIVGSSSPTGRVDMNERLSRKRGEALRNYLRENLSLPDSLFRLSWNGEDWQGLLELVENSDMPSKERAADIIRDTPVWVVKDGKVVDGRKRQLMLLDGGRAWAYMKEHLFPVLQSSAAVECIVERIPVSMPEPAPVQLPESEPEYCDTLVLVQRDTVVLRDTVHAPSPITRKPFYMALKTNMLYDAALVPNLGAEFYLGRGWTVGVNWMYAWWNSDRKSRYWRVYGGELDIRKYFGRRAQQKPLTGHHIGIYGQALTYDFEWGGTGYLGGEPGGDLLDRANWGVGVEYGYSLPVARRLNIDFSIGVGYLGGRYYEYDPADGRYLWKATRNRHWFGPTKAEISLVWLLGRGNYNKEKGGAR